MEHYSFLSNLRFEPDFFKKKYKILGSNPNRSHLIINFFLLSLISHKKVFKTISNFYYLSRFYQFSYNIFLQDPSSTGLWPFFTPFSIKNAVHNSKKEDLVLNRDRKYVRSPIDMQIYAKFDVLQFYANHNQSEFMKNGDFLPRSRTCRLANLQFKNLLTADGFCATSSLRENPFRCCS